MPGVGSLLANGSTTVVVWGRSRQRIQVRAIRRSTRHGAQAPPTDLGPHDGVRGGDDIDELDEDRPHSVYPRPQRSSLALSP